MTNQSICADVAIVGGGMIGLSIAYESMQRGLTVIVIDSGEHQGIASRAAAGMIAPIAESAEVPPSLVRFANQSCRLYPEWIKSIEESTGLDCGYSTKGSLLVAVDIDQRHLIDRAAEEQTRRGQNTVSLSVRDILRLEPALSPRISGGFLLENDHAVNPRKLAKALRFAVEQSGVLLSKTQVQQLVPTDSSSTKIGRIIAHRSEGSQVTIDAPNIVVAGGAWSNQVLPPSDQLPLRPIKGQIVRLRGDINLSRVVRTPDVYLVPHGAQDLWIGASVEDRGFEHTATAGVVMELIHDAWRVLPSSFDLTLASIDIGFRPTLRDHLPAIGKSEVSGLTLATGHHRHGIMLAPQTAKLVGRMLTGNGVPDEYCEFSPHRFHPKEVKDDDYGKREHSPAHQSL